MASFTAFLAVGGTQFPLLSYELALHQETDSLGRPASPTIGGTILCTPSAPGSDSSFLHEWMLSPTKQQDGRVILMQEAPAAILKTISFFSACCVRLTTDFQPGASGGGSLIIQLKISPQRVSIGAIIHDNN